MNVSGPGPRTVSGAELARLRWLKLRAEQKALEARLAENRLACFLLAIEGRYRLQGRDAVLDLATGTVQIAGGVRISHSPIASGHNEA